LFCITSFLSAIYLALTTLKTGYIPFEYIPLKANDYFNKYCTRCEIFVPERAQCTIIDILIKFFSNRYNYNILNCL
ncbi:hypothetical protein H312_03650, partial [Anncaliia algerae PRA339]